MWMKPFSLDNWIVYRLWRISQEAGFELEAWYKEEFGLSATEWHALAILANQAPLAAKDLAQLLDIHQVQMTRTLTKLFSANLVYRHTDKLDRRRIVLGLSKKGNELYGKIAPKAAAIEEKMLSVFTAQERSQLDKLLSRLEGLFRN
jgi:DNA-binding MarR family transcriptional regulator